MRAHLLLGSILMGIAFSTFGYATGAEGSTTIGNGVANPTVENPGGSGGVASLGGSGLGCGDGVAHGGSGNGCGDG